MSSPVVARRYAAALYSVASRLDETERIGADLRLVQSVIHDNPALADALKRAAVPEDAQKRVLTSLFEKHIHQATLQFLHLAIDKRRPEILAAVAAAYVKIADDKRNVQRATVTSAVELTDAELSRVRSKLQESTGKSIQIESKVDPGIIGGLVMQIGDRILDGSVVGQLRQMHKSLSGAR